jgi:hypothetical protein
MGFNATTCNTGEMEYLTESIVHDSGKRESWRTMYWKGNTIFYLYNSQLLKGHLMRRQQLSTL